MRRQNRDRRDVIERWSGPQNRLSDACAQFGRPQRLVQQVQVHSAEQRQKELRRQVLRGRVELRRPPEHREHGERVADHVQQRPETSMCEEHRAADQDGVVREQPDLGIRFPRQQKRRGESAADRHQRETLRSLPIGKGCGERGDDRHQDERDRPADQVVQVERGVCHHIEHRDSAAGDHLAVDAVARSNEPGAGVDEEHPDDRALNRSRGFVDPVVLDRELLEVAHADDDRDDADVQQPACADAGFERIAGGHRGGGAGHRRRSGGRSRGQDRWRRRTPVGIRFHTESGV